MRKILLKVEQDSDITEFLQKEVINSDNAECNIVMPRGNYFISSTIRIGSNVHITGEPELATKLTLKNGTNNNMFTNRDRQGNNNIIVEHLWLDGNASKQFKPEHEKRLSFCNLLYFKDSKNLQLRHIKATDCKQTAMHFNQCADVYITDLEARGIGWSGISTSGTDDIKASRIYIFNSGKDTMHSAVHFDGGIGSYFNGVVEKCSGNGVMLDSKYSIFNKGVVEAKCIDCKRGVSLSGDHKNLLSNVLIKNTKTTDCEVGVMVSNSKHVFIDNCTIQTSSLAGVLLQGKNGGCDTVIADTTFKKNKKDISEIHNSGNNYFVGNNVKQQSKRLEIEGARKKTTSPSPPPPQQSTLSFLMFSTKGIRKFFLQKKDDILGTKIKTKALQEKRYLDKYSGPCSVCGQISDFVYYEKSVRESYRCQHCEASLRHRGQAKAIVEIYGKGEVDSIKDLVQMKSFREMSIYEPGIIGPLRKYLGDFKHYKQSYYWDDFPLGDIKDGIQNQNLENLSFRDNMFDIIITADIFEHIRKPWQAFQGIQRVLKHGGRHIFTIPVQYPLPEKTIYRVDISSDKDVHLLPERYHIAGDGGKSLVYTEFGKDMLQTLDDMGLITTYVFVDKSNKYRKKNITFISIKI